MREFVVGRFGFEFSARYFLVFDYFREDYIFEIGFSDYGPGDFVFSMFGRRLI